MQLTEQIQLKSSPALSDLCHKAKNLFNLANFHYRQFFFNLEEFINYYDLYAILKHSDAYTSLPAQTAQQTLLLVIQNWKSYWKAIQAYKTDPSKFAGRPKFPKYKLKNGEVLAVFTNQNAKIRKAEIHFPKSCGIAPIKTRILHFQQIRILPKGCGYVCEIIYNQDFRDFHLNPKRCIGCDLGLNTLVAIVNNIGRSPILIKGGWVKSANQYYNKRNAFLQSMKDKQHYEFQTHQQQRLLLERNNRIRDYFHKTSDWIINYCIDNNIGTIVIGYNEGWKQEINLGTRNNQNFVQIPYAKLISMIQYKAQLVGIQVLTHEEAYTSKCSFLDSEPIEKHETYLGKRLRTISLHGKKVKCNLFRRSNGQILNGDVNGAYNILIKTIPNAFAEGRAGLVLNPVSVRFNRNFVQKPIESA